MFQFFTNIISNFISFIQHIPTVDLFTPDAEKIMTIILPILKDAAEKDEESSIIISLDIISSSAARVASIMGDLFLPFLPSLLSYLLKKLNKHTDVSISVSFTTSSLF